MQTRILLNVKMQQMKSQTTMNFLRCYQSVGMVMCCQDHRKRKENKTSLLDGMQLFCRKQEHGIRKVFPFYVLHRLQKLARWRWNRLRDAVAFEDDFCLWCLFESNNREWWSPYVTDLNDRLDVSSGDMTLFYYYLCGANEDNWIDLMAFESGTVAWRDSCDEIWKSARSRWNALNAASVFDGVCLPSLFA